MAISPDIDNSKMPLLEHLVELRQRMLRSFVVVIVLFFVCYFFSESIYRFLMQPLADIQAASGGSDMSIDSVRPPDWSPKSVPRSWRRLNST